MTDKEILNAISHELLRKSYLYGTDTSISLDNIATQLGLTLAQIYDPATESGYLWNLGPDGMHLLDFQADGRCATVRAEKRWEMEIWCDYKRTCHCCGGEIVGDEQAAGGVVEGFHHICFTILVAGGWFVVSTDN